jgi:putative spermidine/putrescine transport system ATP-binding protein
MAQLELVNLTKAYGDNRVVDGISLDVEKGELVSLLGPSGCGKTTTLRMIAGFVEADAGSVFVAGKDIVLEPAHKRNLGVVFQNYALFPHKTVFQNIAYGLRQRRIEKAELRNRTMEAISLVRLDGLEDRLPRALSGGQQQRVAIARALVVRPDVLLLDEPMSNLDAQLRHDVRKEIRSLQQSLKITTVLVTHDQEEAMAMGDRLAVIADGRVQQFGTAADIYERPVNRFVGTFIGSGTILDGSGSHGTFRSASGLTLKTANLEQVSCVLIRPEAVSLDRSPSVTVASHSARIERLSYIGPVTEADFRLDTGDVLGATFPSSQIAERGLSPGADVEVNINPQFVFGLNR